MLQNTATNTPSVGAAIGRVAVDMLKITVAVAGGIAVYKLAENYLSGGENACLGCGGGATTGLPDYSGQAATDVAAFQSATSVECEW